MSINGNIGKLEETLKVLADVDQRLALTLSRVGGSERMAGLIGKGSPINERDAMPDDLVSRFDRNLAFFMSLNESIVNTIEAIDTSLGIDTGSVDRPKGYNRVNFQKELESGRVRSAPNITAERKQRGFPPMPEQTAPADRRQRGLEGADAATAPAADRAYNVLAQRQQFSDHVTGDAAMERDAERAWDADIDGAMDKAAEAVDDHTYEEGVLQR